MTKKIALAAILILLLAESQASSQIRKEEAYAGAETIGYVIDDTNATFHISMPERLRYDVDPGKDAAHPNKLYASYAEAADKARGRVLPSFEQIGYVGKVVDDDIHAAIELASGDSKTDILSKPATRPGGKALDVFMDAVKSGELTLKPTRESGWYDYQQFSLEPFLLPEKMPEGKKLSFDSLYRKRLENAFRTRATQTRETRAKRQAHDTKLAGPSESEVLLLVRPSLKIEPMPTYYMRIGDAYGFLQRAIGEGPFKKRIMEARSSRKGGARKNPTIADELRRMRMFFYAMYAQSSSDIGLGQHRGGIPPAEEFISGWKNLPEMRQDVRVIVPMGAADGNDPSQGMKCRAVLGIAPLEIQVRYEEEPKVTVLRKGAKTKIRYGTADYTILTPVFAEVVIPDASPPTREEFRRICDKYVTKDAIIKALKKGVR